MTRRAFSCVTPGNVPAGNPATTCIGVGAAATRASSWPCHRSGASHGVSAVRPVEAGHLLRARRARSTSTVMLENRESQLGADDVPVELVEAALGVVGGDQAGDVVADRCSPPGWCSKMFSLPIRSDIDAVRLLARPRCWRRSTRTTEMFGVAEHVVLVGVGAVLLAAWAAGCSGPRPRSTEKSMVKSMVTLATPSVGAGPRPRRSG